MTNMFPNKKLVRTSKQCSILLLATGLVASHQFRILSTKNTL
ncbi:MAG: hypothetical protein JWN89_566 [Parcubacteria group bacterium]|nr:hypothetical protein [Parcubacteria group bacterium]